MTSTQTSLAYGLCSLPMSYLPQIESRLALLRFFETINKADKNISATATPCTQLCDQKSRRISVKGPSCVATALLLARPCPCLIQIESTAYMALHQSNNPTSGMKSQQPGGGRGVSQCLSVRLCSNCSPLGPALPLSYLPQIESPGTLALTLLVFYSNHTFPSGLYFHFLLLVDLVCL